MKSFPVDVLDSGVSIFDRVAQGEHGGVQGSAVFSSMSLGAPPVCTPLRRRTLAPGKSKAAVTADATFSQVQTDEGDSLPKQVALDEAAG
jgi:hypothetical protein